MMRVGKKDEIMKFLYTKKNRTNIQYQLLEQSLILPLHFFRASTKQYPQFSCAMKCRTASRTWNPHQMDRTCQMETFYYVKRIDIVFQSGRIM